MTHSACKTCSKMTLNDTSGQAHPYWYEWFVGLVEVVKLLNPDEGITQVAFQVASIQEWDDVVVTLTNGKRLTKPNTRVTKTI